MALQTVTLYLPEMLYRQVARRAQQMRRSVEDELVEVVSTAMPTMEALPSDIVDDLEQLTCLTDAEMWEAARTTLPRQNSERMQALVLKRQGVSLTAVEERELKRLTHLADRVMLVRAQAAVVLKERGHNIESLGPAEPV